MVFQKLNKKGFQFKGALFALVAVSLMVLAFGVIISEQADRYGTDAVSELSSFNELDTVSSTAEGYEESLTPEDQEPGEDPEAGTFRGVYGIVTGLFRAFNVVTGDGGMIDSLTTQFGLPIWVRQGMISIFFIALAMSIVAVIFRLSRTNA